jgi:hypothetical protein
MDPDLQAYAYIGVLIVAMLLAAGIFKTKNQKLKLNLLMGLFGVTIIGGMILFSPLFY